MVRLTGPAPSLADGIPSKGYVDTLPDPSVGPPVGWMIRQGWASTANAILTSGRMTLGPIDVGWQPYKIDAIGAYVSTAQSGGTLSVQLGIYKSDAFGLPDTAGGPIAQATMAAPTTTGNKWATLAAELTIPPGRYWLASLLLTTAAPTTAPQFAMYAGVTYQIPVPQATLINSSARGLYRAGLSAMATDASTSSNLTASTASDIPILAIRRSS